MRLIAVTVVACLMTVTGCSSNSSSDESDEEPSRAPSSSAGTLSVKDVCPEIEAALPPDVMTETDAVKQFGDRLLELHAESDTEARNAIDLLGPATLNLREALEADAGGSEFLDVRARFLDGLNAVARRCKAAGSTALQ